jgi:hypothetical protein
VTTVTGVFPQRQIRGRWEVCPAHKATKWAAIHRDSVVGRYTSKTEAQGRLNVTMMRLERRRSYSLGREMGLPKWRG